MIYELFGGKIVNILSNNTVSDKDNFISDDSDIRLYDYDPRYNILNNKKNIKKHIIEDNFDETMKNGYDTNNGYFLSAQKLDMDAFSKDAILHERAVSLGIINASDNVLFMDKNGIPRILTVSEYISLLVNYGLWCRQQIIAKSSKMYLLDNATNQEEIDAI